MRSAEITAPVTVCFPFVGDEIGGSHISALGLIRGIDKKRFRPLILLQVRKGQLERFFNDAGVEVQSAPRSPQLAYGRRLRPAGIAQLLSSLGARTRFLRGLGAAIVHTNDGRSHATWALPTRLAGAKLVWHHRADPSALGLRLIAPLAANRVISVSRFSAPKAGLYSAASKTEVIHSPFDTDVTVDRAAARAELIEELGVPADTVLIGFFGALIERKRPLVFVEAMAALRRMAPRIPLLGVLFGQAFDGMDGQVMRRAAKAGAQNSIRLMGFRPNGDRWLSACDILMVPAIDEPFGRTLIEAMLVGTPVVATTSGGNGEALRDGETGLLVAPDDPGALAAACHRLLSDPRLYGSIAAKAHSEARSRYGERRHVEAVTNIYEQLLAHRPTVSAAQ
jgi:glycosyltransferase involved in cell wall biosynthesis